MPSGMRPRQVGSKPFDVEVGPGASQASELVWLYARQVVASRAPGPQVDVIAICSSDPSGPGGRRVLGYLPATLVKPYSGMENDKGDNVGAIEAGAKALATAMGLRYTEVNPAFGSDPNIDFPGAYPQFRGLLRGIWINALMFIGLGVLALLVAFLRRGPNPIWIVLMLSVCGVLVIILGILLLPPVTRLLPTKKDTAYRRT